MIPAAMRSTFRRFHTKEAMLRLARPAVTRVFVGNSSILRKFSTKSSANSEPEVDFELINDTQRLEDISVRNQLVKKEFQRTVAIWLLISAGAVFGMIVLGGYTRLSKSGLSMTKWKPIQSQFPTTEEKWEEEFEHYKVGSPEPEIPRVPFRLN